MAPKIETSAMSEITPQPRIGLALGSGSARGWSHIGVIRALDELGIQPDIVCGTSIGALVGGFYVTDQLPQLEQWLLKLDLREVLRYLDIDLLAGGFIEGKRLIDFFRQEHIGDVQIETLATPFAAVATDLANGEEVWLQHGSLLEAIRASIALPGFFTPVQQQQRWLVDGGLVNPVPVSLCHALGADKVIAVNLNSDITGKHLRKNHNTTRQRFTLQSPLLNQWLTKLKERSNGKLDGFFNAKEPPHPGLFDVLASSINIMQDRITRERFAGHPAEIVLEPKLSHLGLLEFDRAAEAIEIGYHCTLEQAEDLQLLKE